MVSKTNEDDICNKKAESVRKKAPILRKKSKRAPIFIHTQFCKYDIVRECAKECGMIEVNEGQGEEWMLCWIDTGVAIERVLNMEPFQKINHFPGMNEICNKDTFARNLCRLSKSFPVDYHFFPKTWILPTDWVDFVNYYKTNRKKKVYISKPSSSCQGKGIHLFQDPTDVKPDVTQTMVIQKYIHKVLLIDGLKFDFRIYVLVTSCDPLQIYIYKDGLARFATEKYHSPTKRNMENTCMHLTNYAINKNNEKFTLNNKRSIQSVLSSLQSLGHDIDSLWTAISDIVTKTIITIQPILSRNYGACFKTSLNGSSCFEILGFDILIDHKLKPWVLEVNHSPSFTCDTKVDHVIKRGVISDAMNLLDLNGDYPKLFRRKEKLATQSRLLNKKSSTSSPSNEEVTTGKEINGEKKTMKNRTESNDQQGQYMRIFPCDDPERMGKYNSYLSTAAELFSETAATKCRKAYMRLQKEKKALAQFPKKYPNKIAVSSKAYALAEMKRGKKYPEVNMERIPMKMRIEDLNDRFLQHPPERPPMRIRINDITEENQYGESFISDSSLKEAITKDEQLSSCCSKISVESPPNYKPNDGIERMALKPRVMTPPKVIGSIPSANIYHLQAMRLSTKVEDCDTKDKYIIGKELRLEMLESRGKLPKEAKILDILFPSNNSAVSSPGATIHPVTPPQTMESLQDLFNLPTSRGMQYSRSECVSQSKSSSDGLDSTLSPVSSEVPTEGGSIASCETRALSVEERLVQSHQSRRSFSSVFDQLTLTPNSLTFSPKDIVLKTPNPVAPLKCHIRKGRLYNGSKVAQGSTKDISTCLSLRYLTVKKNRADEPKIGELLSTSPSCLQEYTTMEALDKERSILKLSRRNDKSLCLEGKQYVHRKESYCSPK